MVVAYLEGLLVFRRILMLVGRFVGDRNETVGRPTSKLLLVANRDTEFGIESFSCEVAGVRSIVGTGSDLSLAGDHVASIVRLPPSL